MNPYGAHHCSGQPLFKGFARQQLPLKLGLLINIAGVKWGLFIGRGVGNLPLHPDSRAVYKSPDALLFRCGQQMPRGIGIDLAELIFTVMFGAEGGGNVKDSIARLICLHYRFSRGNIHHYRLYSPLNKLLDIA